MVTNYIYTYFATGDKNVCQRGGQSMYILYSSIKSHDFYKISKRLSPSNGSKKIRVWTQTYSCFRYYTLAFNR